METSPRTADNKAPGSSRGAFAAHLGASWLPQRVGATIVFVVGIAASCALAGLWLLYDVEQRSLVTAETERTMAKLSESVIRGVESMMRFGSWEVFQHYSENLKQIPGITDLRVLRIDGTEAFRDNITRVLVNERLGAQRFPPRENLSAEIVLPSSSEPLKKAIEQRRPVIFYERDQTGDRTMTILHPLQNEPTCHGCHAPDHPIRGIVKVTTSLGAVQQAIAKTRYTALAAAAAALIVLLGLTHLLLRLAVVRRVKRVGDAMNAIVMGDFSRRVPDTDVDEFGDMARSFNRMAENLLASSSQLHENQDMVAAVLRSAHEGIVVADRKNEIIMTNAAAEQMLGKSAARILTGGLENLFDSPNMMKTWRSALGDTSDDITYRGKPLQVYLSSIRGSNRKVLGFAVLMRDMSGERQLRDEVRRLHFTDEQTGTGNERYLDHALSHCWSRARATDATLSVMLFSVDTLRQVTLSEGREVAEAILKSVVQAIKDTFGSSAAVARMAGDTFAVVTIGLTLDKACSLAQGVLKRVGAVPVGTVEVWASAGVATIAAREIERAAEAVEAASEALAQAIEIGGGCVRMAEPRRAVAAA